MTRSERVLSELYRRLLITCASLNADRTLNYSSNVPSTRWGEAVTRLLSERGWTKRQLADRASVRPNTITNLIKHGKDTDTATLSRIADAFEVDLAELFLTREESAVLQAHRTSRVDRLRDMVVKEVTEAVTRLVAQELGKSSTFSDVSPAGGAERTYSRRKGKRTRRSSKE